MLRRFSAIFVLLALVSAIAACQAQAGVISGVSASASTIQGNAPIFNPLHVVNGDGLAVPDHTSDQALGTGTMWVAQNEFYTGQYLTIDLGKNYALSSLNTLRVWNYNNVDVSDTTTRGMKNATFLYLADDGGAVLTGTTQPGGTFTQVAGATTDGTGATFDKANGLSVGTNSNYVSFNESITARYIRILAANGQGIGNYGGNFIGLSEVQVFQAVPEPGTLALLAAGLIGLLAYAWRKRK